MTQKVKLETSPIDHSFGSWRSWLMLPPALLRGGKYLQSAHLTIPDPVKQGLDGSGSDTVSGGKANPSKNPNNLAWPWSRFKVEK